MYPEYLAALKGLYLHPRPFPAEYSEFYKGSPYDVFHLPTHEGNGLHISYDHRGFPAFIQWPDGLFQVIIDGQITTEIDSRSERRYSAGKLNNDIVPAVLFKDGTGEWWEYGKFRYHHPPTQEEIFAARVIEEWWLQVTAFWGI